MILPPARITISCSMISPCRALSLLRRTGRRCQTTRCLFAPGGDTDCRPSRRICFRLYARAGFLHVFRVLEMQCFVLSYLLSPKPTRWTLRPASRKHGLCSIAGAQTHPGELCTTSAPAQPNGRAFFGIGPDIGLFASSFAKSGSFHHFWLYEPNRDVHQSLAGNFRGLSFTINSGIFHASDMPAQSSTAVMIHVLDHLLQPKEFLHEVRASLEPGGVILIVTHDCASGLARLLERRWPPYTVQHPQLFSRRSLAALLQASGFDVFESVKTTNYFPVAFLMRAALTVFGLPEHLIPAAESPLLGLKLGNIGTIARKST